MLFKGKVGANLGILRGPRSFQKLFYVNGKVFLSKTGFLDEANWPTECCFRAS